MLLHVTGKVASRAERQRRHRRQHENRGVVMDGATGLGDEKLCRAIPDEAWHVRASGCIARMPNATHGWPGRSFSSPASVAPSMTHAAVFVLPAMSR